MGLAQADAAIDEERVVRGTWTLGDLHRRGTGDFVGLSRDERIDGRRQEIAEHGR